MRGHDLLSAERPARQGRHRQHGQLAGGARAPKVPRRDLKGLFRATTADLMPPEVLGRGKQGFAVPLARWFRGPLSALLRDTLCAPAGRRGYFAPGAVDRMVDDHVLGKADHAHHLWALLILELWHREFRVASIAAPPSAPRGIPTPAAGV
ncbi:MAG: hypothetical protein DMD82_16030 [Candidatus Rokuibacteriota bacterium]|nr:MAG: hypothetical protein DMD82_16030 [Candidatus Rokubacteria bacterium]